MVASKLHVSALIPTLMQAHQASKVATSLTLSPLTWLMNASILRSRQLPAETFLLSYTKLLRCLSLWQPKALTALPRPITCWKLAQPRPAQPIAVSLLPSQLWSWTQTNWMTLASTLCSFRHAFLTSKTVRLGSLVRSARRQIPSQWL